MCSEDVAAHTYIRKRYLDYKVTYLQPARAPFSILARMLTAPDHNVRTETQCVENDNASSGCHPDDAL
jgi:hypothetical protein